MSSSSTSLAYGHARFMMMAFLSLAAVLSGCGEQKKSATQVAARVGADEITIGQVNGIVAKMQATPGKTAAQVKREVLDSLIDQQLVMRQAIDKKIDREPAVMQAIEEAKRSILVRAYADKIRAATPEPSAAEIGKYYADHSELFAQRRIFNLNELNIAVQPGLADFLRDQLGKGATMEAVVAELKSKNIPFTGNASAHAAEETPFEILSRINALKEGEMTLIEGKGALTILQLVAAKSAPVDEKTASASIRQYLSNNRSNEEIAKELKSLKAGAKIEFFGEFVAGAEAAEAPAVAGKMPEASRAPDVAKAVSALK